MALVACWVLAYRRRSFGPLLDLVCLGALVLLGRHSVYTVAIGVSFNAIWLRSMYGSLPRTLLFYGGCVAAIVLAGAPSQEVGGLSVTLLITLGVGRTLAVTLTRHHRALTRERVLRSASERLLHAEDLEAIGAIGEEAAREVGSNEALDALVALASERRRAADELAHQASHDVLTGLANRALLTRRLEEAEAPAVVFIDLDDFKAVNDRLGHAAGDALLVAAGRRIAAAVRSGDTVARLGGDEFAIVVADRCEAETVAARIAERLAEPFTVGGQPVRQSASIGIADQAPDADRLLRHADIAMYAAKARGKAQAARYEDALAL